MLRLFGGVGLEGSGCGFALSGFTNFGETSGSVLRSAIAVRICLFLATRDPSGEPVGLDEVITNGVMGPGLKGPVRFGRRPLVNRSSKALPAPKEAAPPLNVPFALAV